MKIAVVTDNGETIAQHFGRARYYQVFTIENKAIVNEELRDRAGTLHHHHDHDHDHDHDHHSGEHHHGHHGDANHHAGMVAQITDVDLLLAGGMGPGAQHAIDAAGIKIVATDVRETKAAVEMWVAGQLQHKADRLH